MEPARSQEPTTFCGVCGSPKPLIGNFCRACNHYDTWSERSPLLAALRQILVGTILVGLISVIVNTAADALIKSSDELQKERERQNAAYEALHEELRAARERLIRSDYRLTNETRRCPYVGAESHARCVEYVRALRQQVYEELFSLDWTTPLLFAQIDAQGQRRGRSSARVERALDVAVTVLRDARDTIDGLDVLWAERCGGSRPREPGLCLDIWECRRDYASAAAYCISYASCMTFEAEARLLARISGDESTYPSSGCSMYLEQRAACAEVSDPAEVVHRVLATKSSSPADWRARDEACERLVDANTTMGRAPARADDHG